jgi:signal peptidase II
VLHVLGNFRWLTLSAVIIVIDQITKLAIEGWLPLYGSYPLIPHLNLVHLQNTGAAFSMFREAPKLMFIGLATVVSLGILAWMWQNRQGKSLEACGLALILGGAIGNVIDRVRLGHVTDFVDFYVGSWHFAAFNVADMAISTGAGLLILDMLLEWRRSKVR